MTRIIDMMPKPKESAQTKLVQAHVDRDLAEATHKELQKRGWTWVEFITVSMMKFKEEIEDSRKKNRTGS